MAYQGSAVLVESDDAAEPALPVQTRNLYVMPFRQPVIDKVMSSEGEFAPIFANSVLHVHGRQLEGDGTRVLLAGAEHAPDSVTDKQIVVTLPAGLRAGPHALQVCHKLLLGTPPAPHRGFESNVATFVLRPRVNLPIVKTTVPDPQGGPTLPALQVSVDLTVGRAQRVVLLLNPIAPGVAAYSFLAPPRSSDGSSITVAHPGVTAGQYYVRLQIDGAESPLDLDSASPTFGPTITLP